MPDVTDADIPVLATEPSVDISHRPQYLVSYMRPYKYLLPYSIAFIALTAGLVFACTTSQPSNAPDAPGTVQVPPGNAPASIPMAEEPEPGQAPRMPEGSSDAGTATSGEREGGLRFPCQLTEPVRSQDACKAASDCAPAAVCHATSCVAKANAPTPPDGGALCTMNLVCRSIDVGRCDCVDGVCALVPR